MNDDDVLERLRRFDEIHSWYGTARDDFRAACSGLPFRYYPALPRDSLVHVVDFYLAQVGQPLGASPHVAVPRQAKEPFAIIHPFSGSIRKNWPMERWQELAERLGRRMPVHWCAGPGAIVIEDLYRLAEWIGDAHVFIGNDSGISHLAAAAGTSTIALFGPTDPAVWAPRGAAVTVIHRDPIADITAQEVAEAVP